MRPPKDADAMDAAHITVSGHQMDVGDALRGYATDEMMKLSRKYLGGADDMICTFNKTGNGGFLCSIRVQAAKHYFDGKAEAREVHAAFNQALEHVDKQLRRLKRELREDKPVNPDKEGLV